MQKATDTDRPVYEGLVQQPTDTEAGLLGAGATGCTQKGWWNRLQTERLVCEELVEQAIKTHRQAGQRGWWNRLQTHTQQDDKHVVSRSMTCAKPGLQT